MYKRQVCTLGPSSSDEKTMEAMLKAGMNVVRLNFSHGTHEEHKKTIEKFRHVREDVYKRQDLLYAAVGRTTMLMDQMEVGECFADIVGPLGKPTHMEGLKKVCVVGGGTGNALAYPLATGMKKAGVEVDMIEGFKTKELVILEDEFRAGVDRLYVDVYKRQSGNSAFYGNQ